MMAGLLILSTILLMGVSGCADKVITEPVAEPPDVPMLEAPLTSDATMNPLLSDESELSTFEVFSYEDIDRLPKGSARNKFLKDAVQYAIDLGVLRKPAWAGRNVDAELDKRVDAATGELVETPLQPDARPVKPAKPILFKPAEPMTYGEFYKWYERFRLGLKAQEEKEKAEAKKAEEEKAAAKAGKKPAPKKEEAPGAETAETPLEVPAPAPPKIEPGPLRASMEVAGETLTEKTELTRQQLALLYGLIKEQSDALGDLDADTVASMRPENAGEAHALEQFMDYQAIDADLKRYVGYAYSRGMLGVAFGQSPGGLTEDSGFGPKKPVSRAEALMVLYWAMKP